MTVFGAVPSGLAGYDGGRVSREGLRAATYQDNGPSPLHSVSGERVMRTHILAQLNTPRLAMIFTIIVVRKQAAEIDNNSDFRTCMARCSIWATNNTTCPTTPNCNECIKRSIVNVSESFASAEVL